MAEGDKSKIEDIKRHLYDRENVLANRHREGVLHPVAHPVSETWNSDKEETHEEILMKKPPTSGFKKFFLASLVFFVVAIAFAGIMYFTGSPSVTNDNIDIKVLGNAFTKGGEELPLQIEITNHNKANLELAELLIEYPRGAEDNALDVIRLPREKIGTIKPGQSITKNVKVTLFGDEKSIRNVKVSLEYHPEGSNAIFSKEKEYQVTISSAPLALTIEAPADVTSEQEVSFTITATLNTTLPEGETMLQVAYPSNFVFESATPAPVFNNSIFSLEKLAQGSPVTINIKGRLIGQDGDQQVFHVYAGLTNPHDKSTVNVVYTSLLHTVTIAKPFLEARILVDSQDLPTYTANGGQVVNADIEWANNLSSQITDAQIIVTLSGNAYDKTTVDSKEGFFDSAKNQIVWDRNTKDELATIEPGEHGTVSFSFKPISLIGTGTIKQPQVALDVSIRGRQPSLGSSFDDINNFAKKIVKIVSDLQITASAVHKSGPKPPKAEKETQYTVTWILSNSANSVLQTQARAVLPTYVKWVGAVSKNENITYNDVTREVIWNIGTVAPYTGFNSNREGSFTIALTPSLSQVDSTPQLVKEINLTGTDSFTNTLIKAKRTALTTFLTNDPTFKNGDERVIQ